MKVMAMKMPAIRATLLDGGSRVDQVVRGATAPAVRKASLLPHVGCPIALHMELVAELRCGRVEIGGGAVDVVDPQSEERATLTGMPLVLVGVHGGICRQHELLG
jgi:hypothetical protein